MAAGRVEQMGCSWMTGNPKESGAPRGSWMGSAECQDWQAFKYVIALVPVTGWLQAAVDGSEASGNGSSTSVTSTLPAGSQHNILLNSRVHRQHPSLIVRHSALALLRSGSRCLRRGSRRRGTADFVGPRRSRQPSDNHSECGWSRVRLTYSLEA